MEKTARNLVIVESPNKCSTLTKIFKDAGYTKTVVMASYGHFTIIKDGGNYWNTGIDPKNNFKTDYVVSPEKIHPSSSKTYKQIVEDLKFQVNAADKVYICSDPDREGEAIAWSLKKFLKIPEAKYNRVTFHEITPAAVLKAFDKPRKIDEHLVDAAQCRQKLDKITGYRLSPIARKKVYAKSVGRCQSAGLKLIVDREKEILNFVKEKYYELYLLFNKNGVDFKAKYVGTPTQEIKKFSDKKEAQAVKKSCTVPYTITNVESKDKLSNPKAPFITSTFQQEVSSKLGVGVKEAMAYAQKLFEGIEIGGEHIALITYIRTDSAELAPEFLPKLEDHIISTYGEQYYAGVKKAKKSDLAQDGHEAIRPVDMSMTPSKLSKYLTNKDLLAVYEIIYKRTEACAMAPAVTSETTYEITSGNSVFNLVSRELKFDGFKRAYDYVDDKDDDDDIIKETFKLGEQITDVNDPDIDIIEKTTNPPARYKEATFIKELESKGIGRPSTFATIVETLLSTSRGYCKIEDKCIVPTELGIKLSDFLTDKFPNLFSISYTAEMEKDLDLVASGKNDSLTFLTDFYNMVEDSAGKVMPAPAVTDKVCPNCGKPLVQRTGKFGKFFGCSGYPKCTYIERIGKDDVKPKEEPVEETPSGELPDDELPF